MDWIIQLIRDELIVKAFNAVFGSKSKSSESSFSLISFIFLIYFYIIAFAFVLCFYIIKFFYYTIPKYLIKKYKNASPKKQAFVRIILLSFINYIFIGVNYEYLDTQDYQSLLVGVILQLGVIVWWGSSIKKYKKSMSLTEKEKVHLIVNQAKVTLCVLRKKLLQFLVKAWKNTYIWGMYVYTSTLSLNANSTVLYQYQKSILDMIYYYIIY